MNDELYKLAALLESRLQIIGDADMRENDPDKQLKLLQEVSEEIASIHLDLKGRIKPRLDHFLENCSYQKAIDWIEAELGAG